MQNKTGYSISLSHSDKKRERIVRYELEKTL